MLQTETERRGILGILVISSSLANLQGIDGLFGFLHGSGHLRGTMPRHWSVTVNSMNTFSLMNGHLGNRHLSEKNKTKLRNNRVTSV